MGLLSGTDIYWRFAGECAECGRCAGSCRSLTSAGMTLGAVAKRLLEHDMESSSPEGLKDAIAADTALVQAVRGCFFCTTCQQVCFADNDVCGLIYAARKDFQSLGLIPRDAWSSVLVDEQWHIFTAYRAIFGIGYPDLTRHIESAYGEAASDCDVAFFPGCSLSAYGPELTREVFATVESLGGKTTMIDLCCGSSLKSAGFLERAGQLSDRILDEVLASGARTVVTVCPGCCEAIRETVGRRGASVRVVSLPHFLLEKGFEPVRGLDASTICLAKSCQDRDGTYLDDTMRLLGLPENAPVVFRGCCGAGGAVSAFDYDQHDAQSASKLDAAHDGDTFVSMCPTCTYTYAFNLMSAPQNVSNLNYLELVFDNGFDWQTVSDRLNGMWTGEYGPWLAQVFA